jgi:hypothetical protein
MRTAVIQQKLLLMLLLLQCNFPLRRFVFFFFFFNIYILDVRDRVHDGVVFLDKLYTLVA